MIPKSRSRWQEVRKPLVVAASLASFAGILALIAFGYRLSWTGFLTKTLWDWLQLLIIPVVLAIAGFWLSQIQKRREERITQGQKEVEQEVATDNQRESLLQAYIDKMSELLVEKQLHKSAPENELREIARVRTLTVLSRLDGPRKRSVLQFLHEASLIDKDKHIIDLRGADLRGAKLSEATLFAADLRGVDLRGANLFTADLSGAKLSGVNLCGTDLSGAYLGSVDLSRATLDGATLSEEDLHHANLRGATLNGANLRGATLSGANLRGATLCGADLREADLRRANLSQANLSQANLMFADLSQANLSEANLSGATLDGANLGDARVTTELEASAKEGVSVKLPEKEPLPKALQLPPNPDEKYARFHKPGRVHGPLRTFGGPLRIPNDVRYDLEENTVMYIQQAKYVLVIRLILPVLILLGLIIATFYFPSFELYIVIAIFIMLFVIGYSFVNYIDDIFILTTKRIIHIKSKFIFFFEEHDTATYDMIRDIKAEKRYPLRDLIHSLLLRYPERGLLLRLDLDIGPVIVRTPDQPDIVIPFADAPFFLQDMIFLIKNHMQKKEERKQ
jgi:uncharacterized protein YjbI with pentapeptide repeats